MITGKDQSAGAGTSQRNRPTLRLLRAVILIPVLILVLFFGVLACSINGESHEESGARIQFEEEVIDLGTAMPGDELEIVFVFHNIGDEVLTIGKIDTEAVTEGC